LLLIQFVAPAPSPNAESEIEIPSASDVMQDEVTVSNQAARDEAAVLADIEAASPEDPNEFSNHTHRMNSNENASEETLPDQCTNSSTIDDDEVLGPDSKFTLDPTSTREALTWGEQRQY